jgi:ATP-dependent exoDNAse (exonuclease V) alpha subunit
LGLPRGDYATVTDIDLSKNQITVQLREGALVTYDPSRVWGVNVYRRQERDLAAGDRIQFTAPFRQRHIANRQTAFVEKIDTEGHLRIRLDSGRTVEFNLDQHPHLDHGYAMTSHSSQGQTADRVIIHVPGREVENRQLVNQRFAYVALSRARYQAEIYTNNAADLARRLSRDTSKTAAIEVVPVAAERVSPGATEQHGQPLEQSIA